MSSPPNASRPHPSSRALQRPDGRARIAVAGPRIVSHPSVSPASMSPSSLPLRPPARSTRRPTVVVLALASALVTACGGSDGGGGGGGGGTGTRVPARVEAVGGATLAPTAVGTAVSPAPSVRVVDAAGVAVSGVQVTFAVSAGGGAVAPATATTDDGGVARLTSWTMGQQAGAQSLTATAAGVTTPVVLTTTAVAGPAASLAPSAGDAQTAAVGTAVGTAPAVRVTDQYGNPVAGTAVTFAATAAGNGTVAGAAQTTDANGVATVGGWTLGSVVGAQRLTATAGALAATFTATATVSGTPTVQVQGGSGQSALVGTSIATPPSVIVRDASGRALAGVTVTFTASGNGVVTGGTQTTNVDGVATVGGWQLATTSGANVLTASVTGVGAGPASAQVFATGTAGTATRVVIRQQPVYVAQSTRQIVAQVQLEDAAGNVVSGTPVTVVATIASGPGTISSGGSAATETASGIAVIGVTVSAPGTYTFTFSVPTQPGLGATAVSSSVTVP